MKKRIIGLLAIIALVLGIAGTLVACNGEKEAYSITVLSPAREPIENVSVSWMSGRKVAGKATTDSNGVATKELPKSNYTVELSGYGEGLTYSPAKPTATTRKLTMVLSVQQVEYSVTVNDANGNGVANVRVTWMNENGKGADTTTQSNGIAKKTLDYDNYTVTLSFTDGKAYESDGDPHVTGKNPSTSFTLTPIENAIQYSVKVQSEGGLLFGKRYIRIVNENDEVEERLIESNSVWVLIDNKDGSSKTAGQTDENGEFVFLAAPGTYTAYLSSNSVQTGYADPGPVTLTAGEPSKTIELKSSILPGALKQTWDERQQMFLPYYMVGDIIHDYTFTTTYEIDGKIWSKSISQLFQEGKDLVIINNWGDGCINCVREMPAMQAAYADYKDRIEIIGVNNYSAPPDSDDLIQDKYASKYTFPMMQDANDFTAKFALTSWPTTIFIDRYGAIAHMEIGSVESKEGWVRLIEKFTAEDYVQDFVPGYLGESINNTMAKPDVDLPENHYELLGEAMNGSPTFTEAGASLEWYGDDWEYAWPFLYADENTNPEILELVHSDVPVLYASNWGKANSEALLYANVKVKKGMVFTFEYYADSELALDELSIFWDGRHIGTISGYTDGKWLTCYMYCELEDTAANEYHGLTLIYMKNDNDDNFDGLDNVFIRNIRFVSIDKVEEELEEGESWSADMFRSAGYGPITEDGHFSNYVKVTLEDDGYYYVDLSDAHDDDYAKLWGTDKKPMLFANLGSPTPWNTKYSLVTLMGAVDTNKNYIYSCKFDIGDGLKDYREDLYEYAKAATASYIPFCVPVDSFLQKLLVAFMKEYRRQYEIEHPGETLKDFEKEWLEVCCFYSHYGEGDDFIGNPIEGVTERTAIAIEIGQRYTANLTRDIRPFPKERYKFTPGSSGVYKFESFIPLSDAQYYAAQMWLYDEACIEQAIANRGSDDPNKSSDVQDNAFLYDGSERNRFPDQTGATNLQNFVVYYYLEAGHEYYLALAFMMPTETTGKYDFMITRVGDTYTELAPCSDDIYLSYFDESDTASGEMGEWLAGAIEYEYDEKEDRYYALDAKGKRSGKIYMDTKYGTSTFFANGASFAFLLDKYITNPLNPAEQQFKFFDFRYCNVYQTVNVGAGYAQVNYMGVADLSELGDEYAKYKDYTEIIRDYVENKADKNTGLVEVDQQLVEFMTLFFELRRGMLFCTTQELDPSDVVEHIIPALENEWLRFCWYYRTHNAETP